MIWDASHVEISTLHDMYSQKDAIWDKAWILKRDLDPDGTFNFRLLYKICLTFSCLLALIGQAVVL